MLWVVVVLAVVVMTAAVLMERLEAAEYRRVRQQLVDAEQQARTVRVVD